MVPAAASTPTVESPRIFDREAEDCYEFVPDAYGLSLPTSKQLTLRVQVVLDGISVQRGQEIISSVVRLYDSINITIVPTFSEASLAPDEVDPPPLGNGGRSHGGALLKKLKDLFGGSRPAGSDVVYLMSVTPITGGTAGFADCIGGVRYPGRAFAAGEVSVDGLDEKGWFQRPRQQPIQHTQ